MPPWRVLRLVSTALAVIGLVAIGACETEGDSPEGDDVVPGAAVDPEDATRDGPPVTDPPAEMPSWIAEVSPPPNSQTSGTLIVSVDPKLTVANQAVRLVVDGVDVTAMSNPQPPSQTDEQVITPNVLQYDPEGLRQQGIQPPVDLVPGRHSATARLISFQEGPDEGGTEVDSFTWVFEIL